MAWRCTGSTNAELILNMAKAGIIKSDRVVAVIECIEDSEQIVLKTCTGDEQGESLTLRASSQYGIRGLATVRPSIVHSEVDTLTMHGRSIGYGATISAPHMVRVLTNDFHLNDSPLFP